MTVQLGARKSKFIQTIKVHPFSFMLALFLLTLGITAGASTCGASYRGAVLTNAALLLENGADYSVLAGVLRAAAVNFLVYALITSVRLHKAFMPLSVIVLAFYGFLLGFTAKSFLFEFDNMGILWQFMLLIPNCMTLSAMLLGFMRCAGSFAQSKKDRISDNNSIFSTETSQTGNEIMLLILGSGMEGVVIPLVLRLLLY